VVYAVCLICVACVSAVHVVMYSPFPLLRVSCSFVQHDDENTQDTWLESEDGNLKLDSRLRLRGGKMEGERDAA
jgi:hypothetical protein